MQTGGASSFRNNIRKTQQKPDFYTPCKPIDTRVGSGTVSSMLHCNMLGLFTLAWLCCARNLQAQGEDAMFKRYEELAEFHEANVNAALRGTGAAGRGVEACRSAWVAMLQGASKRVVSAALAAPRCQGPLDLVSLQSDVVKGVFELWMLQSQRITQIYTQSTRAAMDPLERRLIAGVSLVARARA